MGGTVRRGTTGARVVITLEVEASNSLLNSVPGWRRNATHLLREVVQSDAGSPTKLIAWLRRSKSFTVTSEKIEVWG